MVSGTMNDHDVFVEAEGRASAVRVVVEAALGAVFAPGQRAEPVLALLVGTTKVSLTTVTRSRTTSISSCRGSGTGSTSTTWPRDAEREFAIARRVFNAMAAQGGRRCSFSHSG